MQLIKKNIHMNKCICEGNLQFTLDSDINVTDSKPDIASIIYGSGDIKVDEQHIQGEKLYARGTLLLQVLYQSEGAPSCVVQMQGEIPFSEAVNLSPDCGDGTASLSCVLEDLSVTLIHSRKISVKALVSMDVVVNELRDEECVVGVEDDGEAQQLPCVIDITGIAVDSRDTYRFKDTAVLPAVKPEIAELLLCEAIPGGLDIRLMEDKFSVRGELDIFMIYRPAGEDCTVEFYETVLPLNAVFDCSGCRDDMIPDITVNLSQKSFEIQADEDGEERAVAIELLFDVRIRIYEDKRLDVICDIYDPKRSLVPEYRETMYEKLLMRNCTKLWQNDTIQLGAGAPRVLQICGAGGSVKLDDARVVEGGIHAEGFADIHVFYLAADESRPIWCVKLQIPFSQLIEIKDVDESVRFRVTPVLEQVNATMQGVGDMEVKAGVALNAIVFMPRHERLITDCTEQPTDYGSLQDMPSMTGYIVKDGDTLWDISKRYRTTLTEVMSVNGLESEKVKAGDKLLIIKDIGII